MDLADECGGEWDLSCSGHGAARLWRIVMVAWWLRFGAVPEMSPRRLYDRLTRGDRVQIVDVRTHQEFSNGHIAGAVSVPIQSLRRKLPELALDPSRPVVTICKTAHRSIPATRLLRAQGFDAAQLAKGMDEWRRQQLPVERS